MKLFRYVFLAGAMQLTACATIMSDNQSAVQIDTEPTGTICEVKGENFNQIVNIPANVTIPAKAAPVTITCTKDEYFPASKTIDTKVNGMIFGNIIFGGIPGIIIDLATQSGFDYQDNVAIRLYRNNFTSQEEKEAYYADILTKLNTEVTNRKAELNEKKNPDDDSYKKELKKIEENYQKELKFVQECKEKAIITDNKESNIAQK